MYTSRQCTYTPDNQGLRQWTVVPKSEWATIPRVPIFPAANHYNDEGHLSLYWWGWHEDRLFQEQTTMKWATCRSIDSIKMRTSSTVNTRATYQWKQVDSVCSTHSQHAKQVWSNRQFQKAMTIGISKFSCGEPQW